MKLKYCSEGKHLWGISKNNRIITYPIGCNDITRMERLNCPECENKGEIKPETAVASVRYVNDLKIEKGIPIPHNKNSGKRKSKYPFMMLEVDESIQISIQSKKEIKSISACLTYYKKKYKRIYKYRITGVDIIRVWRIA